MRTRLFAAAPAEDFAQIECIECEYEGLGAFDEQEQEFHCPQCGSTDIEIWTY